MKVQVTLRFELDSKDLPLNGEVRCEEDRLKDYVNALVRGVPFEDRKHLLTLDGRGAAFKTAILDRVKFPDTVYFTIERLDGD